MCPEILRILAPSCALDNPMALPFLSRQLRSKNVIKGARPRSLAHVHNESGWQPGRAASE